MEVDNRLIENFEKGLDPAAPEKSEIPAEIIGFGEISAIFRIDDNKETAYKRMPLFRNRKSAEKYTEQYHEYCQFLKETGMELPDDSTVVIDIPKRPVVIYIAQKQFASQNFAHKLIHSTDDKKTSLIFERIIKAINGVWTFNEANGGELELAIDGQLSNWVYIDSAEGEHLYYIDTSTPLYKIKGEEQLDPELLLQSAPSFLKWIIKLLFLSDVMNRYYDPRQVYVDLAANLYKEQRPDLIPLAVELINKNLFKGIEPLTMAEIKKYYKEDKLIWTLFLSFRRIDRWIKTRVLKRRYEFILPGNIKR
ncbi:MAG: DUF6206 family protein [Calditrichaceae bacterium]